MLAWAQESSGLGVARWEGQRLSPGRPRGPHGHVRPLKSCRVSTGPAHGRVSTGPGLWPGLRRPNSRPGLHWPRVVAGSLPAQGHGRVSAGPAHGWDGGPCRC